MAWVGDGASDGLHQAMNNKWFGA
ncbi:hypothetical protein [Variovorax sp. NFACC29]